MAEEVVTAVTAVTAAEDSMVAVSIHDRQDEAPLLSTIQLLSYPTPDSSRSLFCVLFGTLFVEDEFDDGKPPNAAIRTTTNIISDITALKLPP